MGRFMFIVGLLLAGLMATTALAQDSSGIITGSEKLHPEEEKWETGPLAKEYRKLGNELRCPTCVGMSVLDSDAPFSVQIKDILKEQLEAGKSHDEVMAYFTERYGPWILRSPPKQGFNLVAWGIPVMLLLFGPVGIWAMIWRKKRVVPTFGARPGDDIIAEMNEQLTQMRNQRA